MSAERILVIVILVIIAIILLRFLASSSGADTRWVATYEPDEGWRAKVEIYRATRTVQHLTCPHRHRTAKAAESCARSMVDQERPERITL